MESKFTTPNQKKRVIGMETDDPFHLALPGGTEHYLTLHNRTAPSLVY